MKKALKTLLLLSAAPLLGQNIYINEYLAGNDACCTDENGEYDDFIEIYNGGSASVDIGGMYITDDLSKTTEWQIPTTAPDSTTIDPGGFLVLWADKESEQGILHVEIKLSGDGEQIGLYASDGSTVVDTLTFDAQTADVSQGRNPDGSKTWETFSTPTPGASNTDGLVFDPPPYPFKLVYPFNDTTIVLTRDNFLDTLYFAWNQSVDPYGHEVTYERELTGDLQEHIRFTVESNEKTNTNRYKIPYHHIEYYMHAGDAEVISGTWTVVASDGNNNVYAENGPFTLTIDGSQLNISESGSISKPEKLTLHANYPNPFNPTTIISYDLPEHAQVTIGIYDILGTQIKTLVNQPQDAGNKTAVWRGTDDSGKPVSAGVYLYQIQAGGFLQTRKMLLVK